MNNDINSNLNNDLNDNLNNKLTIEERQARTKKRKKKKTLSSVVVFFGCLLVLVVITFIGGYVYMWAADKSQDNVGDEAVTAMNEDVVQVTYTQEELDAMVAEAAESARAEASETASAEILNSIQAGLEGGQSFVETLRPFYPDDLLLVSGGKFHFVPIQDNLKMNNHVEDNLVILETGEYQYMENGQVISHKGIDVSKFQGDIDWQQVAEDGVEFAFIRVGLRGYGSGKLVEDEYFEQNIKGALSAGIKVGVYFYTQAINEEELMEEANFVLERIAPYKVELPVVFDVEKVSGDNGRMNALSLEERTNLTLLFCQTIENAGYKPMIYHNMEMSTLMLDLETLENYDKWFAYYNADFYYPYEYSIWQYSDTGRVNGIKGNVDLNISFGPLWEE